MAIIGLESSAHTFGVGIVDEGKILANEKSMYNIGKGGMIPAKVAEHHIESARDVIVTALEKAGLEIREIEGVGYTRGPGIGPCLQVAQISSSLSLPINSVAFVSNPVKEKSMPLTV